MVELVDLKGSENKYPSELSGGMQQRVALARALVVEPDILLLDEPLSALDAKVRQQMQLELKRLHNRLGLTFILVTHDQEEALTLSNKVVVMSKGRVEQIDSPKKIYDNPRSE
jgi:spermidine/putrescine transport system ATP-binding protein